jgi:hypothetical protein
VTAGNFANASFEGAKTVNGAFLDNVSTNPATFTAATSVVCVSEAAAFSTIVFEAFAKAPKLNKVVHTVNPNFLNNFIYLRFNFLI